VVTSKEESFMLINYMALPRLQMKMVTLIGGNTRIVSWKDMEHMSLLVETDTLANTCRLTFTGMEYSDGQVEEYIKDNGHRVKEKVMHITSLMMAQSIMVSSRMICSGERE
jgi:urate oxidase